MGYEDRRSKRARVEETVRKYTSETYGHPDYKYRGRQTVCPVCFGLGGPKRQPCPACGLIDFSY